MALDGVHFLGIAESVTGFRAGDGIACTGVVTLGRDISQPLFPFDLSRRFLVITLPVGQNAGGTFELRRSSGEAVYTISVNASVAGAPDVVTVPGTCLYAIPIIVRGGGVLVFEPGILTLVHLSGEVVSVLGEIRVRYAAPPPITDEQRLAIRAQPGSFRMVAFVLSNRQTGSVITAVAALDRSLAATDGLPNPVWYEDLPDYFEPESRAPVPLRYLRESMHWLLVNHALVGPDGRLTGTNLYDAEQLQTVLRTFRELLDSDPHEDRVQSFIEDNLVLLSPFGARHLMVKPPILNMYVADFGLVNAVNELVLIEIERPGMRLFTKKGATCAELNTPLDQVRSWFREIDRDRDAAMRCIRGFPGQVTGVRGFVIAGRSMPSQSEFLARYQGSAEGARVSFMTYDQLITNVVNILKHTGLVSRHVEHDVPARGR